MYDSVELKIRNRSIRNFLSYTVESSIYIADSAFSLVAAHPELPVAEGDLCELYVSGELALSGIVDVVGHRYDKASRGVTIRGRDFMGLLVDSYAENFVTIKDRTLREIAEILLADIPFISRRNIEYNGTDARFDEKQTLLQIEPGQRIFEVLRALALSRGLVFWARPDGTMVFGKPRSTGDQVFSLNVKDGENRSKILSAESVRDISRGYSRITVLGQEQGSEGLQPEDINVRAVLEDGEFPFFKPFVTVVDVEQKDPHKLAALLLQQQRAARQSLRYSVKGHSQNGHVWAPDMLCGVHDEKIHAYGQFLVYGRVFSLSRDQGQTTELELGMPGVIQ
jgi:prophage tail gpP-like protein